MYILAYTVSILLMILLPIVLTVLLRRRFHVPWFLFLVGALTFAASQAIHLPLNSWLSHLGWLPDNGFDGMPLWRTALILGLTAGLCEELARTIGFALLKRHRRFEDSLMLGLGHGGIESMVFGGVLTAATISSLYGLQGTDLQSMDLTAEQLAHITSQMEIFSLSPWMAAMPLIERALAITAHIILSMLVWQAFQRRNALFVILAILYHTLLDAALVYCGQQFESNWLLMALFLAILLPGIAWVITRWKRRAGEVIPQLPQPGVEWGSFFITLRKELLQQWRTRRILVVCAAFAFFGIASPLLAYFMPEIFKSFDEIKEFANLIPEPSTADAMAQYIKNITQFGFILALLLGMGSVANEKVSGTAAMILSRPLPRWAFLLSKFSAQLLVYLLAFLIAAAATWYYTYTLFNISLLGEILAISGLLFIWLLIFAAAAHLGSTLAGSSTAAAGIGLGFSALLLLLGYIPNVGALLPGGLIAWAGQIASIETAQTNTINAGALAASFTLILLFLIGSTASFENQEL